MIPLTRPAKPAELTNQLVVELTQTFAADASVRVWAKSYIVDALRTMSHDKCSYCEANVFEESKYMEVDHYKCKQNYPGDVVRWDNLLPSCKRCNIEKGVWDVIVDGPMVDPSIAVPKDHIRMRSNYRFEHKTIEGENSIREIYLNDSDRLTVKRFRIGDAVIVKAAELNGAAAAAMGGTIPIQRAFVRKVKKLLRQASSAEPFSAVVATTLARNPDYAAVRVAVEGAALWDADLEQLHTAAISIALL